MNQFQDEKAKLLEALAHESNQPQNNELQQLKDKVQSLQTYADFNREFRLLLR